MLLRIFILMAAVLTAGVGCSKKQVPDPPSARAELTARLFETLDGKRYDEALVIVDKLLALDANDADLMEMRDRIVGNIATGRVRDFIADEDLEGAYKYIRRERKLYPVMPRLRLLEEEVRNLIILRNSAQKLAAAGTVAELTAALELVVPLAAKYPQAEQLHKDIAKRRADLKKMRAAAALAVEEAAVRASGKIAPANGNPKP